jgi:hypothetical protein
MRPWLAIVLAACSFSPPRATGDDVDAPHAGGGNDGGTTTHDGGPMPARLTISGLAIEQIQGATAPVSGVAIAAFAVSDDHTPVATATTDAIGNYTLTIDTHGAAFDGYLRATKGGAVDTYVYPPAPLVANDPNTTVSLIATSDFSGLVQAEGASSGTGVILAVVVDASGNPVRGATASTTPRSDIVAYMDGNGLPFGNAGTNTDGRAFLFDVPSGSVSVSAAKAGMTFASHALQARADKLTTTLVQPP